MKRFPTVRPGKGWITIPEMVERSAQEFSSAVALKMRDGQGWREYTYSDLGEIVPKLAAFLKSQGFQPGDRGAVLGENRPEWGLSYFAISWAGGIVVPLDSRATLHEWRHINLDAECKVIFTSQRFLPDVLEFAPDVPSLKTIVVMDPHPELPNIPQLSTQNLEPVPRHPFDLEDLALILYTSGTTGSSKGVMLTHKNIMSNVDAVYQCIEYGVGDTFFSVLPIHHVFEGTAGFLTPLYNGATIVYARSLRPREIREDMLASQPTVMLVVPLLLEKILLGIYREVRHAPVVKKGLFHLLKGTSKALTPILGRKAAQALFKKVRAQAGFGNIRYVISGGAALPQWVAKGMEELGFPVLQGYGLSETAPVLTVNPPDKPKNASVGLPIPHVEIKIVDPGPDGIGEIAAKGPNVMKGYYKNPEATKEVFTEDGWFLTGDLGYIDDEGYLYITGRKKSVIVTRGGKNIYPEEIEAHLSQSPYIAEILVLMGIHPVSKDEELQAIVYPDYDALDAYAQEHGKELTEEDIYKIIEQEIERLSKDLAPYKRPRRFTIREEEFPKTTTRKIKRYLFEKPYKELREGGKPASS